MGPGRRQTDESDVNLIARKGIKPVGEAWALLAELPEQPALGESPDDPLGEEGPPDTTSSGCSIL